MVTWTCLIFGVGLASAQLSQVSGVVKAQEDGQPIVGATVFVVGTTLGTTTDLDGKFILSSLPATAKTLRISFVGMNAQEVAARPGNLNIVLQSDAKALDEVVVLQLTNQLITNH